VSEAASATGSGVSSGFTGGCLCGAVRYTCATDALALIYCHCKDCQRCTGGPFAAVAVVRSRDVSVVQGEPGSHTVTGEAGGRVWRKFCPSCGSPLFSGLEASPKTMGVKVGSMDDSTKLTPTMHIWTDSKVPWLTIEDQLPATARNPGEPSQKASGA
jgi:hypothetical protein